MRMLIARAGLVAAAMTGALLTACATPSVSPSGRDEADTNVYGAFLAARYALANDDTVSAAAYYERALALEPDNPFLIERAFTSALAGGDMEEAVALARRAVAIEPADRLARILLASEAMRAGRYERAQGYLEGRDLGPFNRVIGALVLAWAHEGAGEINQALSALDAPEDAPILAHMMTLHRALILDRAGRAQEAERSFQNALATGLLSGVSVDAYGRWLERSGRSAEAGALYGERLQSSPEDSVSRLGLERIARGERPEPFVSSAAAGASAGVFGPAAQLIGGQHAELASVYLQLSLYLDPNNSAARYLLGEILTRVGLDDRAHEVLGAAQPGSVYFLPSQISAAWTHIRRDDLTSAIAALEALSDATGDPSARMALGQAYRSAERYEEAAAVFDGLIAEIEGEPTAADWRLYFSRGVSHERMDRWPQAEADLLTALRLSPDEATTLNYLGYSWVDRGERLEEAFELIRRAVELDPDSGAIVDSLGWAHYRLGEFEEAVRHLERAVELSPEDPVINDHLGDAYWRVGRRLEASYQWTRSLSLDPDEELRATLEMKLVEGLPSEPVSVLASDP